MRIAVLDQAEDDVIANDDLNGEFFVRADSAIYYRNSMDPTVWSVNRDEKLFRRSVDAFERYRLTVVNAADEDAIVQDFKLALLDAESPLSPFWSIILEQCEHGLL